MNRLVQVERTDGARGLFLNGRLLQVASAGGSASLNVALLAESLTQALAVPLEHVSDVALTEEDATWDALYARVCSTPTSAPVDFAAQLKALVAQGLTLPMCVQCFAAADDDPYVRAARQLVAGGDDIEIDDTVALSRGDGGTWVSAWLWVSDDEAGVDSDEDDDEDEED